MKNPYDVLEIPSTATDEEVKAAYRRLARKYHPDNYADNPLSDLAGQKMQEINEAYDQIINERRGGTNTSGSYRGSGGTSFPEIVSLINAGRFEQAQELLDGVLPANRNAEWYYLNGRVLYQRGWFDQAYTSFATATRMDPSNAEYRNAMHNAQNKGSSGYNAYNPYRQYGGTGGCGACDVCQTLICADCCCECMGGDLISCC